MQQVDYIIVGQGVAGSWTAYFLLKAKKSFVIIDEFNPASASIVSSGVINPVSGRRPVKAWLIDELLSVVPKYYAYAEDFLGEKFFYRQDILKFFPNEEMRNFFIAKFQKNELPEYVSWLNGDVLSEYLNISYGGIRISPGYRLDSKKFVELFRQYFLKNNLLQEEKFQHELLKTDSDYVSYKNIKAKKIIFCEGYRLLQNPYHNHLPLYPNKGEYLITKIPGFPQTETIHANIGIVPIGNDLFWIGSDYQLQFENELPTEVKRIDFENALKQTLRTGFELIEHGAGIRPTVSNERRPFVGLCPDNSPIALLNGLGAKGVSYAPYFAKQLIEFLLNETSINKEANVARYQSK
jgi:glycine/D-amino acid oxidase-like deaminating enzyme